MDVFEGALSGLVLADAELKLPDLRHEAACGSRHLLGYMRFSSSRTERMHSEFADGIIAARLRKQASWCTRLGSPLYASLLMSSANDVLSRGPCWRVLRGHENDAPGSALALRFLGAVHRLVLEERAPILAASYPSVGGDASRETTWLTFREVVEKYQSEIRDLLNRPVQTNEVGRCAALLGGFLEFSRISNLPLRLLEIGSAAGLNLRWDQYRYEHGCDGWGDIDSNVRLDGFATPPPFNVTVRICDRVGCDESPIDPCSIEGRLTLRSYVWADQCERLRLLDSALDIAQKIPAPVERANAADWVESNLRVTAPGCATVLFHSIVWPYLTADERLRIRTALQLIGKNSSQHAPLAWLRLEAGDTGNAEVRLCIWPGGEDRLLGTCGFHGPPVRWHEQTNPTAY